MSYLKGVVPHVASLVPYQVLVERCSRKMMAMMEAFCPMDKAYLTAALVMVDMLDGTSVRTALDAQVSQEFCCMLRKNAMRNSSSLLCRDLVSIMSTKCS
jgi:hypothetical protein